jgi:hypothetical protein
MKTRTRTRKTAGKHSAGREIITSLKQAIAWAGGENLPVRVTTVRVPATDASTPNRR